MSDTSPYAQAAAELSGAHPTIDVAGETFTLHGALSSLDLSEMARAADMDSQSAQGAALLADMFRSAFGDHTPGGRSEYARFRQHMRVTDDPDDKVLLEALMACVEAVTGFPTQRRSASPASPPPSTGGSRADGSQPAAQVVVPGTVVSAQVEEPPEEPSTPAPSPDAVVVNIGRSRAS